MSEFDQFAGRYQQHLDKSLQSFGADALEFARAKANLLTELARLHVGLPRRLKILDLGCGAGLVDRFLEGVFAEVVGADLARELLEEASHQAPRTRFVALEPGPLPFPEGHFDVVFCACVMHHLKAHEMLPFVQEMRRVTRPGGLVVTVEHNPYNPVTRHIVSHCELDKDVERLLPLREVSKLFAEGGLAAVESRYISFFPGPLRRLDRYESRLRRVPLGGQYLHAAQRPGPAPPPQPEDLDLTLIMPMYNEEVNVRPVTLPLVEALRERGLRFEILLVDNGSRDATQEYIRELSLEHPEVRLVEVYPNRGYGWGILNGLRWARGQAVAWMAGDGQVTPADVVRTWDRFAQGDVDMAKVERVKRGDGWQRLLITKVWNATFQVLFALPAEDVNGTPKVFWRRSLAWLDLRHRDWFLDAELTLKLRLRGCRIGQVPIDFLPREKGRSHVRWKTLLEFYRNLAIFSLRWWWARWTGSDEL